ncbi:MAG: aminotransferase class I/II-fold pyridoxal phosphate-dependent enzyme [Phycisphaerales bacterium]
MKCPPTQSASATHVIRDGTPYLTFGGCNYMGLAHHPRVISSAQQALSTYGLSTSASRQTTGNALPHEQLEQELRLFTGFESSLLLPDGYTANLAALQGLASLGIRHALIDARAHSSLFDAAKLAQMTIHTYNHLDAHHAEQILITLNSPTVILTDAVFTTAGNIAPVHALTKLLSDQHYLLIDDCHGFAVLGKQGRGTANHLGITHPKLITTTTLLKGLGCAGGVVLANDELISTTRDRSTAFICTTPASPALASAACTALEILQTDHTLHKQLTSNINALRNMLQAIGVKTHSDPTPIFSFTLGSEDAMRHTESMLLEQRIILPLMHYPGGPAPLYFRLSVTASHTNEQINQLATALTQTLKALPA